MKPDRLPHPSAPLRPPPRRRAATGQRGVALVTSMLVLVVVTLLAASMYRSFGLQQKIAGNTLEKQRALLAADSAVRYGEWWLSQGNTGASVVCSGVVNANAPSNLRVCSNPLTAPGTLPWANRFEYTPPQMTVAAGGGLNTGSTGVAGDVNYATTPALYIHYMGYSPDGRTMLYRVTGVGYGGSASSASVMQSVYAVRYGVTDLGGL